MKTDLMEDDRQGIRFSPDKPLEDPNDDVLGYDVFAKRLAEALDQMAPQEGFVVAIHGAWGSGKTTVINFLCHYLEEAGSSFAAIRFNPWWFQNREQLTRMFFGQLLAAIGKDNEKNKGLRTQLADFGDAIADLPVPWVGWAKIFRLQLPRAQDVNALKRKLGAGLEEAGKRFLVVIDDIDRLHADETRQMFRLIKAVADLPRLTYLLAFDRVVVTQMLDQDQKGHGEDFLEKIVQVSFDLPEPQGNALHDLAFKQYEHLLETTPEELFDKHHFANLYWKGISHFVRTPRDVTRLMNFMRLTYPAVEGEVNPVDFLGIEALRVFCPHIYHTVRNHPKAFTLGEVAADSRFGGRQDRSEAHKAFHNAWLDTVPSEDRQPVRELMVELFPRLASVCKTKGMGQIGIVHGGCSFESATPMYSRCTFTWLCPQGQSLPRRCERSWMTQAITAGYSSGF
jgi:predicted KAP-like P-loop ATPase